MPPVPKVILARPGAHAALADRATPAGRRRCRRSAARRRARWPRPTAPVESTIVGRHRARDAQRVEHGRSSQPAPSAVSMSPVTAALDDVGDVRRSPSVRCHTIQVSTVPKHRSRVPVGVGAGRAGAATLVADWLGARRRPSACEHEAVADGAQVLPAEAGADRLAGGAVPHDGRRPLVGDADAVDRAGLGQRAAGDVEGGGGHGASASNSTRPGAGESGSTSRWCSTATVASGRTTAARTPLVPTSMTRMLIGSPSCRVGARRPRSETCRARWPEQARAKMQGNTARSSPRDQAAR